MAEKKAAKKEKPAAAPAPSASALKAAHARDIGIDVPLPEKACTDEHCPFHGKLSVRGQILEGVVVSTEMQRTAVVEREYLRYLQKFERFEKRTRRMNVHAPPCLSLSIGDRVTIMECRPLAKTVHFVAVRNQGVAA
jgi:small subunit ribosomal protein S17